MIKAEPNSLMQTVYFISAGVMAFFSLTSIYFILHKPNRIKLYHSVYETSFGLFGMFVAASRLLIVEAGLNYIPVIYIAVLYGVAVIFVFSRLQSVILYSSVTISVIVLIPVLNPSLNIFSVYVDLITNGFIAWLVVHINSRRFIGTFLDKKKIESINIELHEKSIRDGLTGLYNRRKLDEVYNEVCMKASRYELDFAVMIIDIDHFKIINDKCGHHIGDSVLLEIARILENNIREVDVCGRWGGEEFLVICQETEIEAAYQLAERLRETIENHEFSEVGRVTASFGVASWSEKKSPEDLIQTADARMYMSKKSGRNIVTAGDLIKLKKS